MTLKFQTEVKVIFFISQESCFQQLLSLLVIVLYKYIYLKKNLRLIISMNYGISDIENSLK